MSVGTVQRTTLYQRAGLALLAAFVATSARADQLLGQPTPGGYDLQPAGDALKRQVIFFHNDILMPIIVGISLFVLGLLIYVVIRFNKRANPTPAQFTHNTTIEVAWTAAPVLILMFIAIFSFRLLYAYHDMPKPDLTVKVTGNQWYWSYAYPDQGGFNFDSNMLPEDKAKAANVPYRLAVDNPMVVPVGKVVRVLVTGADVIHDFANPAFGLKTDAVPGRVNETWFKAEKAGIYYGQCSELCGVNHAFMPIEIDVVAPDKFNAWVGAHGGKLNATPVSSGSGGSGTGAAPAPAVPNAGEAPLTGKGLTAPPANTTASTAAAKISSRG
jgi:cytochrome c oxidase subunit 2